MTPPKPRNAAPSRTDAQAALRRSLEVYYRDRDRFDRMTRLNSRFLPNGGLAFDIGAHVGDRTASFLRLGARVVALEPQPRIFRALRLIHGTNPKAVLRCAAAGAVQGFAQLRVNSANPTVSTASADFVAAAQDAPTWQGQVWDDTYRVAMTTLDALIAEHGSPDFVKIDVEGFEAEVLRGLSCALPALSFEITTIQRDVALACIDRLMGLGRYRFNLSLGEAHSLDPAGWMSARDMQHRIATLPDAANSGDVFARLG